MSVPDNASQGNGRHTVLSPVPLFVAPIIPSGNPTVSEYQWLLDGQIIRSYTVDGSALPGDFDFRILLGSLRLYEGKTSRYYLNRICREAKYTADTKGSISGKTRNQAADALDRLAALRVEHAGQIRLSSGSLASPLHIFDRVTDTTLTWADWIVESLTYPDSTEQASSVQFDLSAYLALSSPLSRRLYGLLAVKMFRRSTLDRQQYLVSTLASQIGMTGICGEQEQSDRLHKALVHLKDRGYLKDVTRLRRDLFEFRKGLLLPSPRPATEPPKTEPTEDWHRVLTAYYTARNQERAINAKDEATARDLLTKHDITTLLNTLIPALAKTINENWPENKAFSAAVERYWGKITAPPKGPIPEQPTAKSQLTEPETPPEPNSPEWCKLVSCIVEDMLSFQCDWPEIAKELQDDKRTTKQPPWTEDEARQYVQ